MAAQQVEGAHQGLGRIILPNRFDALGSLVRGLLIEQEVEHHVTEGVVHRGIELVALQVGSKLAVANFVRGVFPYLA